MKNKIFSIVCIFLLIFSFFMTSSFAADESGWFDSHSANLTDYMAVIQKYYKDNDLTLYGWLLCDNGYIYTFSKSDFSCFVDSFGLIHGDLSCYLFAFKEDDTSDTSYVMHKELEPHWGMTVASYITKSTFDVLDQNGKVFFQGTPHSLETIFATAMTKETPVQEIVAIIPTILVVVACFLGLRKALRILEIFLKRS